jgi:DNA polymerase elongation subunit (family B)
MEIDGIDDMEPSPKRACLERAPSSSSAASSSANTPRFAYPRPPKLEEHADNARDLVFQVLDWYVPEADREWTSRLDRDGDAPLYQVLMFGVTQSGHSVCVRVNEFEPYFYVRLPSKDWRGQSDVVVQQAVAKLDVHLRTQSYCPEFFNAATKAMATRQYASRIVPTRLKEHLVSVKQRSRKDFWGFTNGEQFPFVEIKVRSLALYNALKRYFEHSEQAEAGYKLYESNIDPFLRFIHARNLQPCGWARLPAGHYIPMDDDFSRAQVNVDVKWDMVKRLELNRIAPLLVASFDIECTSSHGDFPVATKDYRKLGQDLVAAASCTFPTLELVRDWLGAAFGLAAPAAAMNAVHLKTPPVNPGALRAAIERAAAQVLPSLEFAAKLASPVDEDSDGEEARPAGTPLQQRARFENNVVDALNRLLGAFPVEGDPVIQVGTTVHVYGSDDIVFRHVASFKSCAPVEGAEVETFETEGEMLLGWKKMMGELAPDVLIGYNIFGFDMDYMWKRADECGVLAGFGTGLGRIIGREVGALKEQRLSSSALGDNLLKHFNLDGLVSVDLLKVMQRDHKLDSFKLDNVAAEFLGDRKDDLSPNDIFRKFAGSAQDRADIARYCLQDCALVNRLLHKLKVLENNMGMGNVCSVPLSYLFMRGQGIKIFSLVAKACRQEKTLIPVVRPARAGYEDMLPDETGYEGAIVLEPQTGIYLDAPITVLDYSSLYPSSMIERNLSHDCYVPDYDPAEPRFQAHQKMDGIKFKTIVHDVFEGVGDKKTKVGEKACTFAQLPAGRKGIIPTILQELVTQRKNTRKKIEYETVTSVTGARCTGLVRRRPDGGVDVLDVDTGATTAIDAAQVAGIQPTYTAFEQAVLDALQLAYKVTANSLYGQIGSRTSPLYWKDIAASTTATGRERILKAKAFVEGPDFGAVVIYGDTDSIFCKFPCKDETGARRCLMPSPPASARRAKSTRSCPSRSRSSTRRPCSLSSCFRRSATPGCCTRTTPKRRRSSSPWASRSSAETTRPL